MGSGLVAELAICRRLVGARLRGQMQYRGSFIAQTVGNFGLHLTELVAILILFSHFGSIGGWRIQDVAFLYGLSCLSFGIAHFLGSGLSAFYVLIHQGTFDRVLVRPVGTLLQVLAADIQIRRLGEAVQGVIVLGAAVWLGDIDWTLGRLLYLPVVIASAVLLYVSLFAIEATVCFWTTQATEVLNAFTYGGSDMAQYPLHIYQAWLRSFLLFVVPIGFVIYLPSLYLLDKPDPLGLPAFAPFLAPVAATAFALAAGWLWRLGVRHYRSTGS
ncbi:MAG: ABC transporter permease [Chloroflexota bacterium]|nr:ABC transporter permease [Chloroflexota bacterium]